MKNLSDKPAMGNFQENQTLQLIPFPNGGWTILQQSGACTVPHEIGAYSNTDDMLSALNKSLPH